MTGTPDTPRVSLSPSAITYSPASPGALRCSDCGGLVDDDRDRVGTENHTFFHARVGDTIDGMAVRLAQAEEAVKDMWLALDAGPLRPPGTDAALPPGPPVWGGATDGLIAEFLAAHDIPPGSVRLTVAGTVDQVGPAADALRRLVELTPASGIVRDSTSPVREQRAYVVDVNALRTAANRTAAAGREVPGRVPAPTRFDDTGEAAAIARHARAVSLHTGELLRLVYPGDLPYPRWAEVAAFLTEVEHWVKALDTWAESTAWASEAPRDLLSNTDRWCHVRGGLLPLARRPHTTGDALPAGEAVDDQ